MKICIIAFSPSGHTFRVAKLMKNIMEKHCIDVQLLNITSEKRVFKDNALKEYLNNEVLPHDVLCVGGPVYAGHLESNVMEIIKALPSADIKGGKMAIPFITYGGLHSSIALEEAGDLLYGSGRKNIMGMKIACFHSLTLTLNKQINQGKPGAEAEEIITDLVNRLEELSTKNEFDDTRKSFSYASFEEKMFVSVRSQDFFHKEYRTTAVDTKKCTGCGICIGNCPVNLIELHEKTAVVRDASKCILCAECYHKCPSKAVIFTYCNVVKPRLENADEYESPQSALYPIKIKE